MEMTLVFSKEVQRDVDNARNRLNLPGLNDAELVEKLKAAQIHNPATGFSADPAAVFVLREELGNRRKLAQRKGSHGKHDWCIGGQSEEGFPVFVDDRQLAYRSSLQQGREYALNIIARLEQDGDYRLNDKPAGYLPPPLAGSGSASAIDQSRGESSRLFIGVYPCGIQYADRLREENGDFANLAFLSYDTLELTFKANCPDDLRQLITTDAAGIQARQGQHYQVSTAGQTVLLGSKMAPMVDKTGVSQTDRQMKIDEQMKTASNLREPSRTSPHRIFWEHLKNGGRIWRDDPLNNFQGWIGVEDLGGDPNKIQRFGYTDLSLTQPNDWKVRIDEQKTIDAERKATQSSVLCSPFERKTKTKKTNGPSM